MAKRYQWIERIAERAGVSRWAEIGVHQGARAESVNRLLLQSGREITYWGFDLWELLADSDQVFNGKGPSQRSRVEQRLQQLRQQYPDFRYSLIQGDHEDTVPSQFEVDLVFVDGDHRQASIQRDYNRVRHSDIVILDDWYLPELEGFGANAVRLRGQHRVILSEDRERFTGRQIGLCVVTDRRDLLQWIDEETQRGLQ